jgi:acetyltransferase
MDNLLDAPSFTEGYPARFESWLQLKDGRQVFLRPIRQTDGDLLVDLFNKISSQSLYQRFLTRMQSLPNELLYHFTHVDYRTEFALVGVVQEDAKDAIIAVGRYMHDPEERVTDLAVAVRDDWQHLGIGKPLLVKTIAIGKEHGISRFVSMMDPNNRIIRRVLLDLGYKVEYSWKNGFFQVEIAV